MVLALLLSAGTTVGKPPRDPEAPPKTPPSLPVLLPLLEQGGLSPELAGRLLKDGLDKPLAAWALSSPAFSHDCDELTSLDRPLIPDSLDVLHYSVVVTDVNAAAKSITATTTVTLTALRDLAALDFDLAGQTVDRLETRLGTASAWSETPYLHDGLILHVGPLEPVNSGDTLEVRVGYHSADSGCINVGGLPSGVVFSPVGVHTFSEPGYARRWYPCHDVPWDRATFSIALAPVPGLVGSASGMSADSLTIDGRRYASWITPQPVATYHNCFYLGNYVTLADTASSGIPLEYFTYPNLVDQARVDFAHVPDMVDFYSRFFPYPNARYAMSLGYFPGGMEHQMNSLIGYFFIRGDRSSETLFAHELAHQWWGNLVTVDSWRHLWLNEGFATYFDLLYTEHRYGRDEMRARIAYTDTVYQHHLETLDHPILDPPLDKLFSFTIYQKGARVLDMLRGVSRMRLMTGPPSAPENFADEIAAGDARFFSIFPEYAARHAWGNVTSADFQAAAEGALGEDLDWFFTPWLEGTAFPTWEADWNATPYVDGTFMEVEIRQRASDETRFVMPVPIIYRSGNRVLEEVRVVGSESTAWTVTLPPGEWTVEVDPEHWVLDAVEAAGFIPSPRPLAVRPNPSSRGFTLTAAQGQAGPVPGVFAVHDVQGREVRRLEFGTVSPGPISFQWDGRAKDGTRVAPGVYFGRLVLGSSQSGIRLVVLR